jgi:nitroreductase
MEGHRGLFIQMKFAELVKIRQSVRKYSDRPVEKEKLLQCLETARLSPSACNSQPWKFVVVDRPGLKARMAECATSLGMNRFTHQAPVIIAVVLERMKLAASIGSVLKDKEYSLMDVGIAVNQFCLQAAELGLGTCIIGWFDEKKARTLLDIPQGKRVPLLVSVGYPDDETRKKSRKPVEEMSSWNRY